MSFYRIFKRSFDVSLAFILLVILSPVTLFVSGAILVKMGSPIFFKQARPGLNGQIFTLLKFRTMLNSFDDQNQLRSDEERLTSLGKLLRSLSLDEIPQLINVLTGNLSLVGPRPLLVEYLNLYSPEQARRHLVKPGITGWAQVNGRNAISWKKRLELDVWYVDHQSFWLDMKILTLTVLQVIRKTGISHPGQATMPKFKGSSQAGVISKEVSE